MSTRRIFRFGFPAGVLALGLSGQAPALVAQREEVRALWVLSGSLSTASAISSMVETAKQSGFNTLLVQVRGRGDAYFASRLEPRATLAQSGFDPLAETLGRARAAGLSVHAWVNVALVSSAVELPVAPEHIVRRHPEWLMVPRALVMPMSAIPPDSPEYLGRLARWSRAKRDAVEGLYMSPIPAGARDHIVSVVTDLLDRYAVDGIHLDYVRYPNEEFDYSMAALAEFREDVVRQKRLPESYSGPEKPPGVIFQELDEHLEIDPLAYVDAFPERWHDFRQSRLTALVMRLRTAVKARRPDALLSAAVFPDSDNAASWRLQDWRNWIDNGLIDIVCPMAYTPDAEVFRTQIESAREIAGSRPLWAGIGAYRLSSARTIENILTARRIGADGIILFSYDSLIGTALGPDYLAQIARAAFPQ